MIPRDQTSNLKSYKSPKKISGAKYIGVPIAYFNPSDFQSLTILLTP